eukprot:TRINITY_DN36969_c0_g1_i1.p2 TRINITY_DN36969_c0_g1~~TRINITY_DN36969_c0_g1_i1.p2  ORF type:complete len:268 (-),score=50.07 TRINITY_DN36969_c0_g1_i1:39-725(-)
MTAQGRAPPARKDKVALTLIPEQARYIAYRFNVALVGKGSGSFAAAVGNAEAAEAFRPARTSDRGEGGEELQSSTGNVVFCPIGGEAGAKELARLRFQPMESFSDSLPVPKDIANQVIAFLFWKVEGVEERIRDFTSRMAELNFHFASGPRPYVCVLCFAGEEEHRKMLTDFAKSKQLPVDLYDDDCEDTMFECMQQLVDNIIAHQRRNMSEAPCEPKTPKSRTCTVS